MKAEYETRKEIFPMNRRATDIVAYLSWVGLILAFVMGDREGSRFHLNQALVINIATCVCGILTRLPLIGILGWVGGIFCGVCWLLGIFYALSGQERPVPLLGQIYLL